MSADNEKSTPRQRRKEARPSELLAAALDLFVEKGYAATRLEDVAAHAGVSKGTPYLYFDSKVSLLKAVVENSTLPFRNKGEDIVTRFSGSTAELLRHLLFLWWSAAGEGRLSGLCKLMVAEAANFPEIAKYYHDEVIAHGQGLVRNALRKGVASGEFRDIDIEVAMYSIFAPLIQLMLWRHSFSTCCDIPEEPESYLGKHLDIVLHGLLPGARP